jgi:hypothetical protein
MVGRVFIGRGRGQGLANPFRCLFFSSLFDFFNYNHTGVFLPPGLLRNMHLRKSQVGIKCGTFLSLPLLVQYMGGFFFQLLNFC